MATIGVRYIGGDRLRYRVRDHIGTVDQPRDAGGDDLSPTPVELFVASIVTCMGYYAQRFMRRNNIDPLGLELCATFSMSDAKPARVSLVEIDVTLPPDVPQRFLTAIERVMAGCTVHNSLERPPEIAVRISPAEHAA